MMSDVISGQALNVPLMFALPRVVAVPQVSGTDTPTVWPAVMLKLAVPPHFVPLPSSALNVTV
jgi:hypothetical protein